MWSDTSAAAILWMVFVISRAVEGVGLALADDKDLSAGVASSSTPWRVRARGVLCKYGKKYYVTN